MSSTPEYRRGDVVRVRFNPVEGSEQGGERPALVLSPDLINRHGTVIVVAAITSKKTDRVYPYETLVEPPDGGLPLRSKVLLLQLRTVDKRRITDRYGALTEGTMRAVEEALKVVVGLTRV